MVVSVGARLGSYEIVAALGAGGMGEVYKARDTKLGRDVALKILPSSFAHDPERIGRFQREAQLLAALNHPHIAAIYGFEESNSIPFLVLELVEGETLAQHLADVASGLSRTAKRRGLPLPEALAIARQIVDALEAAHEKGIIHRDLRPANIALTADGQVKVLDFGLAKALDADMVADVSNSPTLTFAATEAGVILGTAAYMAPEQAKGRAADKRSDIWAFGCVLYEMLAGKRAFEGEDVSDTLAAILRGEPDWSALPSDVPTHVRAVIERCVEKDRARRIPEIAAVRFLLDQALMTIGSAVASANVTATTSIWRLAMPWAVAGALGVGLATVVTLWAPWRAAPQRAPWRLSVELGADTSLATDAGTTNPLAANVTSIVRSAALALPPDGSTLAFTGRKDAAGAVTQLYLRRLDQLQPTALSGTDDALSPFFSPDGQWIAFFAGGKLKKVSVAGGAAVTLCDAPNGRGGWWAEDGTIIFSPDTSPGVRLWRVSSAGGKPEPLTTLGAGEVTHRWPQVLPGGKAILFMAHSSTGGYDNANLVVQPLPTGTPKVVQRGGFYGRYLRSSHLIFVRESTLFAVPFDLDRLEVVGQPVPVLEGVANNATAAALAEYAVADDGTFAYLPGRGVVNDVPISWMDRQ